MKAGFNLLLWSTHITDIHLPLLPKLKAAGYDGVEVPVFGGTVREYERLAAHIRDEGLETTTVAVMPGDGKNCLSPDKAQRQAALDHMKWLVDCSVALGSRLICGPIHQPLGEFSGFGPTEAEKSHCIEVHKEAAHYAAHHGVTWAIEPLSRFECYFLNTAADSKALVEAVDEPNYGYLYDTFHFNIEEKDIIAAARDTISAISHVHISENDRGPPGKGHIDFPAVIKTLRQAGYDGWMVVESFGSALPDLAAATKVWRPFFSSPEEVYLTGIETIRNAWAAAA